MLHPSYVLLYVTDPLASAGFYTRLLGTEPVEKAPTFVLYVTPAGMKLGLWLRAEVEPRVMAVAGGSEVCVTVGSPGEVDRLFALWTGFGVTMAQAPVKMDFGYTFVALDPDGHRLRVFNA